MPARSTLIAAAVFACAGLLSLMGAVWASAMIETQSMRAVSEILRQDDIDWVEVESDGLLVLLAGTSPTEAARFRALSLAGSVIDPARVIDNMEVARSEPIAAPQFQIELLRNGEDISLIGLIPTIYGYEDVVERLHNLGEEIALSDMLETADHPIPDGWETAVNYGLEALEALDVAKISISAERVEISALSDSPEQKVRLETRLARATPEGLRVAYDISAPRPVITPFTLRFTIDEDGARFDACSADNNEGRDRIIRAGVAAGSTGQIVCRLGLGAPSSQWSEAARQSIAGLAELGAGYVTLSDTDISLVIPHTVAQADFDRVVGELENNLPDVFSLHSALLEEPSEETQAAIDPESMEFIATLSPEGLVQLRGRLSNERMRNAVTSYARSRFGSDSVHVATRIDAHLPEGWPLRALAALESLAELHNGLVRVTTDRVEVRGVSGNADASDIVSRVLSDQLGRGADFRVNVTYEERLDPLANMPTPESCEADIAAVLGDRQISFAPGSSNIDGDAARTLDDIADILQDCGEIRMEVSGHTDSQGRAEMNRALSQSRAEAVINALMSRRVLVSGLVAVGYGQERPIADNDTAEGREANRRIEFSLIDDSDPEEEVSTRQRDPELEALLEIDVKEADADSPRPLARPEQD